MIVAHTESTTSRLVLTVPPRSHSTHNPTTVKWIERQMQLGQEEGGRSYRSRNVPDKYDMILLDMTTNTWQLVISVRYELVVFPIRVLQRPAGNDDDRRWVRTTQTDPSPSILSSVVTDLNAGGTCVLICVSRTWTIIDVPKFIISKETVQLIQCASRLSRDTSRDSNPQDKEKYDDLYSASRNLESIMSRELHVPSSCPKKNILCQLGQSYVNLIVELNTHFTFFRNSILLEAHQIWSFFSWDPAVVKIFNLTMRTLKMHRSCR